MNQDNWDILSQNQWDISDKDRICYFCQTPAWHEGNHFFIRSVDCALCGRYDIGFVTGVNNGRQEFPYVGNRQKISHLLAELLFRKQSSYAFFEPDTNSNLPPAPSPKLKSVSINNLLKDYPYESEILERILKSLEIRKQKLNIGYGEDIEVPLYLDVSPSRFILPNDVIKVLNTRWAFCNTERAFVCFLDTLRDSGKIHYRRSHDTFYINITPYLTQSNKTAIMQPTIVKNENGQVIIGDNNNLQNINSINDTRLLQLIETIRSSVPESYTDEERNALSECLELIEEKYRKQESFPKKLITATLNALPEVADFSARLLELLTFIGTRF